MKIQLNAVARLQATEITATVKYSRGLTIELSTSPKKAEIMQQLEDYAEKLNIVKYYTEDSEQNGWLEVRGQVKGGYAGEEWSFDVNVRTGKLQPDAQTKKKLKNL